MRRLVSRRALAILASASLLTGLGLIAGPALSALAHGPVNTVAREVHASVAPGRATDVVLPIAASHVVLHWSGNPNASVSIALRRGDGTYGDFEPVGIDGEGPDSDVATPRALQDETFGQVVIADGATAIRVRSDRPIAQLTVVALDTLGSALQQAADAAIAASGVGTAAAAESEPTIISRAGWGANESYRFDAAGHPKFPPAYYSLQKLVVHHTDTVNNDPNPAATVRAIYYDHAVIRDWGDIGYNWLIDAQGRVYEGQYSRAYASGEAITGENLAGQPVRGAHAKDYNAGTSGIALLGTFMTVVPPAAQRTALIRLLAWEASRHNLNPQGASTYVNPENGTTKYLPNIVGHRDVNATDCPGDAFYATFPTLRQQVTSEIAAHTGAAVDTTPPTARLAPLLNPTGGSTMSFGLTFDEPVTGLAASDLAVSGTSAGWAVTGISGTGAAYTVTVHSAAPTNGSVILTLAAGAVSDLAGNAGPVAAVASTGQFATDTTAPTVGIYLTPHRSAVNVVSIDGTITFSEPVLGLALSKVQVSGTSDAVTPWAIDQIIGPLASYGGGGANYSFTVYATNPANGTLTITIPAGATTDPAGNPSAATSVTVIVDRTAPTTSVPLTVLRTGLTYNGSPIAGTVTWTGADTGGSGIASYDVARSINGAAFAVIATGLTSPALSVSLAAGYTYRFEVRAHDRAGNVGAWKAGATTSTVVRQDNSGYVVYGSGWYSSYYASYSGGYVHYATRSGASASYTFSGHAIAFVTTKASNRGRAWIYVDGVYVGAVDTYSATVACRQIVWTRTWSSSGSHTIRIVVAGTGGRPRVDIDAFLVLR